MENYARLFKQAWSLSAKALKTLNRSGISTLILRLDDISVEIPTALEMQGAVYAQLSAQGVVSKDYRFSVRADGTEVVVSDRCYRLTAKYELLEIGG